MFNYFDLVVLAVLALSGFFGFQTGILSTVFYVSSGFFGMWAAQKYSQGPGTKFYFIFLAGAGCVILLGFIVQQIFKKVFLGKIDRLIGGALGVLLGLVIVGTVVLPVSHHFSERQRQFIHSSYTGSNIIPVLRKLFPRVEQFKLENIRQAIKLPKFGGGKIDFKVSSPIKMKK